MSLSTVLVDGATLKLALGIDDTSEDALLSVLEPQAADWIERETRRRFQEPADDPRIEYREGTGTRTLFLLGHIDDPEETATVRERSFAFGGVGDWTTLTEGTEYERRGDRLVRIDGLSWHPSAEYEIAYPDGYLEAPQDIQALAIELVSIARAAQSTAASVVSGSAGIKSQTIGEYTYTMDTAAASSVASASVALSDSGRAVVNHWKRARI